MREVKIKAREISRLLFRYCIWYNNGMEENGDRTLAKELAKYKGMNVYIGARSSFFFIGPSEEALAELPFLSAMLHHIASVSRRMGAAKRRRIKVNKDEGRRLGSRKVIKAYEHDMYGGGMVILIEGKEFGMFWTREEYLAERKKLLEYAK